MAKSAKLKKKKEAAAPAGKSAKAVAKRKEKSPPKGKEKLAGRLRGRIATKAQPAKAKPAKAKPAKAKSLKERKYVKFFREVRVELSKVTWPSREELIQSTIVVVIAVAIAGTFIAIWDAIFSKVISLFTG